MSADGMSIQAFNDTLIAFIDQLLQLFAKHPTIPGTLTDLRTGIVMMTKSSSTRRQPLNMFVDAVRPYTEQIKTRDDKYLIEHLCEMPLFEQLDDFPALWTNGKISDENKDAIWQYLNILTMIGITIHSLPKETMDAVEEIAKSIASGGESKAMETVSSMIGSNAGGLGGFNPMSIMGLLGGGKK